MIIKYRFFMPIVAAALRKPITQSMVRRHKHELPMVFLPIVTKSKVPILEGDFNLHKSNSTYFTDLDSSRSLLLSFLVFHGMAKTHRQLAVEGKSGVMTAMLGSTYTNFRREISIGQSYEIWSRILTWDEKWIYIVTHFVRPGKFLTNGSVIELMGNRNSKTTDGVQERSTKHEKRQLSQSEIDTSIFATSISKCVFKKGRLTVSPSRVLDASGLLSTTVADELPIITPGLYHDQESDNQVPVGINSWNHYSQSELADEIEEERAKGKEYADLMTKLEELQGHFLRETEICSGIVTLGSYSDLGFRV